MPTPTPPERDCVLFLSGDLMFASRVRAASDANDLEFKLSGNLPEESDDRVRFVVLDLSTRAKLVPGFMQRCQDVCPSAKCIAYGPHVQVQHLEASRQEGIDVVLTRGQFDRSLDSLFTSS